MVGKGPIPEDCAGAVLKDTPVWTFARAKVTLNRDLGDDPWKDDLVVVYDKFVGDDYRAEYRLLRLMERGNSELSHQLFVESPTTDEKGILVVDEMEAVAPNKESAKHFVSYPVGYVHAIFRKSIPLMDRVLVECRHFADPQEKVFYCAVPAPPVCVWALPKV